MDFQTAVKTCFSKYAVFDGRASRSEYWFFILFAVLSGLAARVVDSVILPLKAIPLLGVLLSIFLLLPHCGVTIRRLHDTNHSGWHFLGLYSPIIFLFLGVLLSISRPPTANGDSVASLLGLGGLIWFIYMIWFGFTLARKGTEIANSYGDVPLSSASEGVETIEFPSHARTGRVLGQGTQVPQTLVIASGKVSHKSEISAYLTMNNLLYGLAVVCAFTIGFVLMQIPKHADSQVNSDQARVQAEQNKHEQTRIAGLDISAVDAYGNVYFGKYGSDDGYVILFNTAGNQIASGYVGQDGRVNLCGADKRFIVGHVMNPTTIAIDSYDNTYNICG